jgi:hypothetical protein
MSGTVSHGKTVHPEISANTRRLLRRYAPNPSLDGARLRQLIAVHNCSVQWCRTPNRDVPAQFGGSSILRPRAKTQRATLRSVTLFHLRPEGYAPSPSLDGARLRQLLAVRNCSMQFRRTPDRDVACAVRAFSSRGRGRQTKRATQDRVALFVCWRGRRDSNPRPPGSKIE